MPPHQKQNSKLTIKVVNRSAPSYDGNHSWCDGATHRSRTIISTSEALSNVRRQERLAEGTLRGRSQSANRPRTSKGSESAARPALLCRSPGPRSDAALRRWCSLPLSRWIPPSHRPEHLGKSRRLAAPTGNDRPLSHGNPLSVACRTGHGVATSACGKHSAARRSRSRRERIDLFD